MNIRKDFFASLENLRLNPDKKKLLTKIAEDIFADMQTYFRLCDANKGKGEHRQEEIFSLYLEGKLTFREIGEKTNTPGQTVERYTRAYRRLFRELLVQKFKDGEYS